MDSACIVIPAIKFSPLLEKCLTHCLLIDSKNIKIEILVGIDNLPEKWIIEKYNKVTFLKFNNLNMSQKRNACVKKTNSEYIFFLDSDAYPALSWISNGILELKSNKNILSLPVDETHTSSVVEHLSPTLFP